LRKNYRPTAAYIDLDALKLNYRKIKEEAQVSVMPVIKADAYGHGAVEAAKILQEENCDILGVATIEEGIELRENSISIPILILGSIYPLENFYTVLEYGLTPIIASLQGARVLEETAKQFNRKALFHLKVDTGMGRIGVAPETAVKIWNELLSSDFITGEGIFTHLANADKDAVFTQKQLDRFNYVIDNIDEKPRYIHAANTAGILNFQKTKFNLVRPGLALYGLYPDGIERDTPGFRPVLSLISKIVFIKEVEKGTPVSYGGTWVAPVKSTIATVCIGYADGYNRLLSNKAEVIVRGVRCPVVGRVCMDMIMVDVTEAEGTALGDDVVLIGSSENEEITAEELASRAGTINYEIVTGISRRVPRIYLRQ